MPRAVTRHLAVAVPLVLALAACAAPGDSSTSQAPQTSDASAPSAAASAEAEVTEITINVGSANPSIPGTFFGTFYEEFLPALGERIASETNYEINWVTAPGGAVAKAGEELSAARDGILDFVLVGTPYETANIPLYAFSFSWVPFCSPSPSVTVEANQRIFEEFPYFVDTLEADWNQKYLGLGALTNYEVVSTFPFERLEDGQGRKIATALGQWFEGTGITAVSSVWPDAYQSMQSGVYEGFLIAQDTAAGSRAFEVAPHITVGLKPLAPVVTVFTFNLDKWDSLPSEVQTIVEEEMADFTETAAAAADAAYQRGLDLYVEGGAEAHDFDPASRAAWAAAMPNIPQLRAAEADALGLPGTEVTQRYIELLEEISGTPCERDWFGE